MMTMTIIHNFSEEITNLLPHFRLIPAGNFLLQENEKEILLLSISLLNLILAVVAVKNDISSNTLESSLPLSIVNGSLTSLFKLSAEKNQKRSKRQSDVERKKNFILLLFISLTFISFRFFMNCFALKEKRTGNSFRRERQQTINKIPIVDEAHAAAAPVVVYMWSILTLISKNFLSLFTCFFSTNKYISIELVQWNTLNNEQTEQNSKEWKKWKKPETIGKGTKMSFHVLSRNTNANVAHTHGHTENGAWKTFTWGKNEINILHHHHRRRFFVCCVVCLLPFLS